MRADSEARLLEETRAALARLLPVRCEVFELALAGPPGSSVVQVETGLFATFRACTYDPSTTELVDCAESEIRIVDGAELGMDPRRVAAFLEGAIQAFPVLMARRRVTPRLYEDGSVATWMAWEIICPPALEQLTANTADEFCSLLLRQDGPLPRWRELCQNPSWSDGMVAAADAEAFLRGREST